MRHQRPASLVWIERHSIHCAMRAETRNARGAGAGALARLNQDHRGARAWLRELA